MQSVDGHDGLPSSMESRQLPPIPMNYSYDKAELHSPDDGHEMQIRPLPPVPTSAGSDDGSFTEEDPYVRLKKIQNDITREDPHNTVKSKSKEEDEDPYSTIKAKSTVEDPYSKVEKCTNDENPYSTIKRNYTVEDPYSKVKSSTKEEDPYSTIKAKSTVEDPYSIVKSSTKEDPYSTIKAKSTVEDPYSKVESITKEDPYSSIKDIRKSKLGIKMNQPGQPSSMTKDEEDPYSTVSVKSDSKSNIIIQVSRPTVIPKLSTSVDDLGIKAIASLI